MVEVMRGRQRGFSLVETMVSTALFTLVTAGVLSLLALAHRSYSRELSSDDVTWQGRASVDLMVRELRLAGYPPPNIYQSGGVTPANSNLVANTFITAAASDVVFEADVDGNGIVERVEYRLNGANLERSAVAKNSDGSVPAAQFETLATSVINGSQPVFTYTVDPRSSLAAPGNTACTQVSLMLRTPNPDPKNGQYRTFVFGGLAYRLNPDR